MKITEAVIVWTPVDSEVGAPWRGAVRVERHHDNWARTPGDRWMPTDSLGEMGEVSTKGDPIKQLLAMYLLFHTIVVRDGIAPMDAHEAFLAIDEYRRSISPDTPGAKR